MDHLIHLIKSYGYLGVFVSLMLGMFGVPLPDESVLTATGYLISKNYLQLPPALLAAYLGSICGITLNYLVGRFIGFPLLHRYGYSLGLSDEKIARAHHWFEKYGKFALFVGLFHSLAAPPDAPLPPAPPASTIGALPPLLTAAACSGWPPSSPWVTSWGRSTPGWSPNSTPISCWPWGW